MQKIKLKNLPLVGMEEREATRNLGGKRAGNSTRSAINEKKKPKKKHEPKRAKM
jgi:hypothetical protein